MKKVRVIESKTIITKANWGEIVTLEERVTNDKITPLGLVHSWLRITVSYR